MPAYMIVRCRIHDYASFRHYAERTEVLVDQFGGKYLVLGGESAVKEGDFGEGAWVVSQWPSREAAETFWNSPEYAEAKKLRADNSDADVMIISGVE